MDAPSGSGLVADAALDRLPTRASSGSTSEPMLQLARERLARFGGRATLVRGDIANLKELDVPPVPLTSCATGATSNQPCPEGKPEALFGPVIDWAEEQFRQLGRRDERDLAFSLLARIQDAALLAQSFRNPDILAREARLIDRRIDEIR
jgi:hypothetical protein